jgi:hypothetical protein
MFLPLTDLPSVLNVLYYLPKVSEDGPGQPALTHNYGPLSSEYFNIGPTVVSYSGYSWKNPSKSVKCNFTVTVFDGTPPEITCPSNIIKDVPIASVQVAYDAPVYSDNRPDDLILNRTRGLQSGAWFPQGCTAVEYLVRDAAGNSASCSFSVVVMNSQGPPTLTCPCPVSVKSDPLKKTAVVTYFTPISSDKNAPRLLGGKESGAEFSLGSTVVLWNSTTASCSFTVTVLDTSRRLICPLKTTMPLISGLLSNSMCLQVDLKS